MPRIALLLFFLFFACDRQQAWDKDFALAYAELRIAEHEYSETRLGKAARFQILQKYDIDPSAFEEKMESIKSKSENWKAFQKAVVDILDSVNNENKE
ncbi:MAG: hypothetical protein LBH25_05170 [Fibromonadaceae bacterium]|nr:hypothetical protein [Fibromonadaceae bacterium]